jgi:TatD DNase family protein
MLVDSHCHLDQLDLATRDGGLAAVVSDAAARGVGQILSIAVDLESSKSLVELTADFPNIYTSVGVHPLNKNIQTVVSVEQLVALTRQPGVIAVGETGLDNFYSSDTIEWQSESFVNHLIASQQTNKPIIIHTRDAVDETIALLRKYRSPAAGVMHCFTESWDMAQDAIDLGFYISFSGIITFKNAEELRRVAAKIPLDRLLVETDSPWLAPVPHRGSKNEPQYVVEVAQCLADIHGIELGHLAQITTQNFQRLFNISTV